MKCDQCNAVSINGVIVHEDKSCPNEWIDLNTGLPRLKECDWCGSEFEPEADKQYYCSEDCCQIDNS